MTVEQFVHQEILYGLEEPEIMLPYAMCATASKARYRGYKELAAVDMVDGWQHFDPRRTTAHVRWMRRFTDDPYAEMTHQFCDKDAEGAIKVWHVVVSTE